jgi:RNA polymerase sigma factor (sigma-70 family)
MTVRSMLDGDPEVEPPARSTSTEEGSADLSPGSASAAVRDALPELYERLRPRLRRVLHGYRVPPQDAEDLVQTTFLLAIAKWDELRDPEAWLVGTLKKRCILYWRRRLVNEERQVQLSESDLACSVEPRHDLRDQLCDLGKAWHQLTHAQRNLLALRFLLGMSPQEVAQAMGLAHGSVRRTAYRALEHLRGELGTRRPPKPGRARGPRQMAAPPLAATMRAAGGAAAAWMAAVDGFAGLKAPHLRANAARYLAAAGVELGTPLLGELTPEDLRALPLALRARPASVRSQALYTVRAFLRWAGERGEHSLEADAVSQALGLGKTVQEIATPSSHAEAEWSAAVDGFLAASSLADSTLKQYRYQLLAVQASLGRRPLAQLAEGDLLAFRTALLADDRALGTQLGVLHVVRSFLVWAARQSLHGVPEDALQGGLRGSSAWRRSPPICHT